MDLCCTRPGCQKVNSFPDLDQPDLIKSVPQKYCTACGMPLILAGRYLPVRLLGQGGFGAAFLARDRHTPGMRQCVVKQFQPSGNLNPQQWAIAQELFEREAEVLENLGNAHPLIPDLFAFFELSLSGIKPGKTDQFFYLVQEFIDGKDLEEMMQTRGQFSPAEVMEMLLEILPVLSFVHENGTIHRDIKPSNIMRHRNGHYYLLDFGAVRQVAKGGNRSTGIYSEGFAPPEQVAGGQVYPSTDLYALAVTCIMLLTGKQPSELYDAYTNTWKWRSQATHVTEPLATVLDRLLLSPPSARYQSAEAVRLALQTQGTPPSPSPGPVLQSTQTSSPPTTLPSPPIGVPPGNPPGTSLQPAIPAPIQPLPGGSGMPAAGPSPAAPPSFARRSRLRPFSLLELLANAGFWGFESCLLAIASFSLPLPTPASAALWLLLSALLVLLQSRRVIEREDLAILAGLTLGVILLIAPLRQLLVASNAPLLSVVMLAILTGLGAIAATALFQLIYRGLRHFF